MVSRTAFARPGIARWSIVLALLAATSLVLALRPAPASAHCDSTSGPVVGAAHEALQAGNVTKVLPYVKPDAEAELTAAFHHAVEVRGLGDEAQALADRYFAETAVRLHRQGEGAPYTGLKEQSDFGPALEAAEHALATGQVSEVSTVLNGALAEGLAHAYEEVLHARENAAALGTVEANRERVEAELRFELYVAGIYDAVTGAAPHGEASPAAGHQHD